MSAFKTCSCGREFTRDDWEELEYLGLQKFGDPSIPMLELRNCDSCRTTLSVETHESSDGSTIPGAPSADCGCQSCRSEVFDAVADDGTTCDECGDDFTEAGPGSRAFADPSVCVDCYLNGDDEEDDD